MSEPTFHSKTTRNSAGSAPPPANRGGALLPGIFGLCRGKRRYAVASSGCALACAWLLTAGTAASAAADMPTEARPAARDQGPTVVLSYSSETSRANRLSSFLYFLPLISLTPVDRESSADNDQKVRFVSRERKAAAHSFHAVCDFEIRGKGFHKYKFDAAAMIAARTRGKKDLKPLVSLLDYVKFEGEGLGRIVIKGRVTGSAETVDQVDLQFHARGRTSPVTIGLYDVKPRGGRYDYSNRSNESIARVSTLTFKRSEVGPTMGVTVDSISKAGASEGLLAGFKGAVANLFLIKPPRIDAAGNKAVLEFGNAISSNETEFTFPKAKNIRETKTVARATPEPAGGPP